MSTSSWIDGVDGGGDRVGTRRQRPRRWRGLLLAVLLVSSVRAEEPNGASCELFSVGEPRTFFFRASESLARGGRVPLEDWDRNFSRLNGIMGKTLDEEIPNTAAPNIPYFTRFKQAHPRQAVLLHFNGNARDPRWDCGEFFAGHWLYRVGCRVTADLPAEPGEAWVRVEDPSLFHVNGGRYRDANDDLGLCVLGPDGKPDWSQAEQLELLEIDAKNRKLRVRRGAFGTTPRTFRSGRTYIAAHAHEGPWGRKSHLLWLYNYSLQCPRDARGRNCIDVLVADVAERFLSGGALERFDGLEFDVLFFHPPGGRIGVDCDADGQADAGVFDGINTYGLGVHEFCRRLRERLGPDRLIMADGHSERHQRSFGQLSGIESEGWPTLSDTEIVDWSGGLNRHWFWRDNSAQPALSYVNYKFIDPHGEKPGEERAAKVPMNITRLVLAAAMLTDSAITVAHGPQPESGERIGVYDELRQGTAWRRNWLGRPLGPPVRLALGTPDLLKGQGGWSAESVRQFQPEGAVLETVDGGRTLKISAASVRTSKCGFAIPSVAIPAGDLFLHLRIKADPMQGYPTSIPRVAWVGWRRPGNLLREEPSATGMAIRGKAEEPLRSESGASVRFVESARVGDERHKAYFVHPPYRGRTGYTFWETDASIPAQKPKLSFFTALSDTAKATSDGVAMKVEVVGDGRPVEVFRVNHRERKWIAREADLARWAGQRVRLRFTADAGPADSPTADQAYWGDVRLVAEGTREPQAADLALTPSRAMTWANSRWFDAGFYFRNLGPGSVDLVFEFEGREPVYLANLTARAHCDAMARGYEHGVVLANPGTQPYTFQLQKLFPAMRLRRLQGSSNQDPKTNDDAAVGASVTVGPRDALFLVRQDP